MYGLDPSQPRPPVPPAVSRAVAAETARLRSAIRPIYRYSIVAGGVRSSDDVEQAMRRDPVVADHYVNVRTADLREERVDQPMFVHASYRIGDKVFWTARTLTLHPGEKVLTDGKTTIRERCGNLLTVEPLAPALMPALMDEPPAPEFDAAVAPWAPAAGYTLKSPPVFFDPPDPPGPPPPDDPPVRLPYTFDSAPVPVPEPSTWALLSLGLMVVIARSFARRRAGD